MPDASENEKNQKDYELYFIFHNYFNALLPLIGFIVVILLLIYWIFSIISDPKNNDLYSLIRPFIYLFFVLLATITIGIWFFMEGFWKKEIVISKDGIRYLVNGEVKFEGKWDNISKVSTTLWNNYTPSLVITRKELEKVVTVGKYVSTISSTEGAQKRNLVLDNDMISKTRLFQIFKKLQDICRTNNIEFTDELDWEHKMNQKFRISLK
jgi:hypothetical protein